MAKTDNLKDFLTDVADAIREKSGESGLINPQDFSARIAAIQTGGGGGETAYIVGNDVIFYDYDGTILHSYSKDEFLALSAMPELPTKEGLTCQGWNWELDEAKARLAECPRLDIAAIYTTDDGKTRLYIEIIDNISRTISLRYQQSVSDGVIINFGDGTENVTKSGTSIIKLSHTFPSAGRYCVTMEAVEGCTYSLGSNNNTENLFGYNKEQQYKSCAASTFLKEVNIGDNVTTLLRGCFSGMPRLNKVSLSNALTKLQGNIFENSNRLEFVGIPRSVTSALYNVFATCRGLLAVSFPPITYSSLGEYFFNYSSAMRRITLPNVAILDRYSFQNTHALDRVFVPKSVQQIKNYAFSDCSGIVSIYFNAHEIIPTIESNAMNTLSDGSKVVVPDALYDEWIAATNWSTKAKYIVKASENTWQ